MHWDFYTLLSVVSGIVLVAASLAGPAVGSARERLSIFATGAFSFVYGIWVATQTSGFFIFSVGPALLAAVIVVRALQHAGRQQPAAGPSLEAVHRRLDAGGAGAPGGTGGEPGHPAARPVLQAAQPEPVRQAVQGMSTRFCPAFLLPGSTGLTVPPGLDYYLSESLAFGWSLTDGQPRLPRGEEIFGRWQVSARIKVAVGRDLNPAAPGPAVSWVTVLDGTGLIALSRHRLIGVVVGGDSLLGAFDAEADAGTGIALWSLPLRRCSSVSVTAVGHGEGLIVSSAEPAGHVTLTDLGAVGGPGSQPAAVPPGQVADLINWARAEASAPIG
jgi:hypothetical protein